MSVEPDHGSLDLESETPCCIQMQGERCARHGPAVERPAPEGCAGCAALREALEACIAELEKHQRDEMGCHNTAVLNVLDEARAVLAASPKESRRG